jgi:hypothetical protein
MQGPFANAQFFGWAMQECPPPYAFQSIYHSDPEGGYTRISEVAIVCEILDPMIEEDRWGRIRHYYYRHHLPEPEARFLTSTGVDELVSSLPRTTILERHNYRTINGVYARAILLGPQRVGRP